MKHNPDDYHESYLRHWEKENKKPKKYNGPRDGGLTESQMCLIAFGIFGVMLAIAMLCGFDPNPNNEDRRPVIRLPFRIEN